MQRGGTNAYGMEPILSLCKSPEIDLEGMSCLTDNEGAKQPLVGPLPKDPNIATRRVSEYERKSQTGTPTTKITDKM